MKFVTRYQWRHGLSDSEPGYRIQSTNGHWCWLSREDAWDAANELSELLDQDLERLEASNE